MTSYVDFHLTEKEYKHFLNNICAKKVSKYIKEHGVEPNEITDEFYSYTDNDLDRYKRGLYSIKNGKTLNSIKDIIQKDYDELFEEFNHSDEFYYWESHMILNKKLEDAESVGELMPLTIENVFEYNGLLIYRTTNLITGENTENRIEGEWVGSHVLTPDDIIVSVYDALKIYWDSEVTRTTGDKVTLRWIFEPGFEEPYYIIGQQNSPLFIFVSAKDGHMRNQPSQIDTTM